MPKIVKAKEPKPIDENIKCYGGNPNGFQVHIVGLNEKGHRIESRFGRGPETMFVNHADWNKYRPYTQESLDLRAEVIHLAVRSTSENDPI